MSNVAEVLEKAAELIAKGWTQGVYHSGWDAGNVPCRHCLMGALLLVEGANYNEQPHPSLPAAVIGFGTWDDAANWNDAPGRTQAEVVAKLREAAALAREQGK